MNTYFKFEPVRTLAALQALTAAVILAVAFATEISAEAVGLIGGVAAGVWGVVATFVRGAVTPNITVEALLAEAHEEGAQDLIDALDALAEG